MAKNNSIVRLEILKDCETPDGHKLKAGKYGDFTHEVATKLIKAKDAKEIVVINSYEDIIEKKPYVEVKPEPDPTTKRQEAATALENKAPEVSEKKTKEEKKFKQ